MRAIVFDGTAAQVLDDVELDADVDTPLQRQQVRSESA